MYKIHTVGQTKCIEGTWVLILHVLGPGVLCTWGGQTFCLHSEWWWQDLLKDLMSMSGRVFC